MKEDTEIIVFLILTLPWVYLSLVMDSTWKYTYYWKCKIQCEAPWILNRYSISKFTELYRLWDWLISLWCCFTCIFSIINLIKIFKYTAAVAQSKRKSVKHHDKALMLWSGRNHQADVKSHLEVKMITIIQRNFKIKEQSWNIKTTWFSLDIIEKKFSKETGPQTMAGCRSNQYKVRKTTQCCWVLG